MKRVILTPAALPSSALAELKQWLGITSAVDDAPLTALLTAALDVCEAFTGALPLEAECEEALPVCAGWHHLATPPVHAVASVMSVAADGTRTPLLPGAWETDLLADGSGRIRLSAPVEGTRAVVRFTAGLALSGAGFPKACAMASCASPLTSIVRGTVTERLRCRLHLSRRCGAPGGGCGSHESRHRLRSPCPAPDGACRRRCDRARHRPAPRAAAG
ncbi:head-tail connector protein [Novosphingobium panipatense]